MSNLFKLLQILADTNFNPKDHPRGQPENAGEFAPKHGGKTAAPSHENSTPKKPSTDRSQLTETKVVDGKRVTHDGKPLPKHIEKLRIPPAWVDVKINHDPDAALLAVGKDSKGRVQSVYSEAFAKTNAAEKFARINELMDKFDDIKKQNNEARHSANPRIKDSADCMHLVMSMGIRPGSEDDTGADKKAFGATNLKGQHVIEENGETFLRFTGKKGVNLNLKVHDPELAEMLHKRAKAAGNDGDLFPHTNDKHLLNYCHTLDGGGFKTKDFRTAVACSAALKLVSKMPKPKNEKEYKKAVMEVGKHCSKLLGNTPAICLQSYIAPEIFSILRAE